MIKALLRTLFILILLLIAGFTFLLTPAGLKTDINLASLFLPGKLNYTKISGVIVGPITIDDLHYQDKQETITIKKLHLNWQLSNLFSKTLYINTLDAQHLRVTVTQETFHKRWNEYTIQKSIESIMRHLPFRLVIHAFSLSDIELNHPDTKTHVHIQHIFLRMITSEKKWDIQFLANIQQPTLSKVAFEFMGQPSHYSLKISAQGEQTNWELLGTGNQTALTLQTPKTQLLNGTLTAKLQAQWGKTLNWQGDINAANIDALPTKSLRAILSLNGDFTKHTLLATVTLPHKKAKIKITGSYHDQQWDGTLQKLTAEFGRNNIWKLEHPAKLIITSDTTDIDNICFTSPAAGNACAQLHIKDQKITGNAKINITHFNWMKDFEPRMIITHGILDGAARITGSLTHPNITGTLALKNGSVLIPELNLTLNNITTSLAGDQRKLNITAQAFSQNQPVQLQGFLDLTQPDFLAQFTLTAHHLLILDTDQFHVYITSQLNARIDNKDIFITGNIIIPEASLEANDFQTATTLPKSDIVYTGVTTYPPKPFWLLHTDLTVKIGNAVHLAAAGFDTQLGGVLRITQQPNQDPFATGSILIHKGTYTVYGQKLTVTPDSSLNYNNSLLNNPTLNIKATKLIHSAINTNIQNFSQDNLIVGVELHGTIKTLAITFFSNRGGMSQADILSYLFLGYGSDSNTPGNTDFLLSALSAVNITSQGLLGQKNIASQIQSGLGLNEMGIESDTTSDTLGNPLSRESSFVIGKHITRNLYFRSSIGLLDPVNVYELRYLFNKHWITQIDSSSLGSGADVIYMKEKN